MAATYGERVKVWPELAFAQSNFQNLLQGPGGPAQATLYIAFHAIHYSAIFKFRARSRSSPIQDSDNDLAVKVCYFALPTLLSLTSSSLQRMSSVSQPGARGAGVLKPLM